MSFSLTDDQWLHCSMLIAKLGGYGPSPGVRHDIEAAIARVFAVPQIAAPMAQALEQAASAAKAFQAALEELSKVEMHRAHSGDASLSDSREHAANQRMKFAQFIGRYEDDLRRDFEWSTCSRESNKRGRPSDTAIVSLCHLMLSTAKHERWATKDSLDRTSPALIDLVTELADCARLGGVTHVRDRRAVVRAMAQAREQYEAEVQDAARLHAELDAMIDPEPKKPSADPNCLCGSAQKSG